MGRDLEDLAEVDDVGVGEVVELGDVADAGAQLLGDDGEGVTGDDGVVDDGALGAGRGGSGLGAGGGRVLLLRLLATATRSSLKAARVEGSSSQVHWETLGVRCHGQGGSED